MGATAAGILVGGSGSRLVFVIEDDDGVRASTRALLESSGFSVKTFACAEDLLNAGTAKQADCLVLDQHLSGISGIELLEALRAQGDRTPAIMVTSNGTQLGARAANAGITVVLRKPLAADALEDWLNRLLPGSQ
jgi:FixJ family two-component response regulator